MVSFAYPYVIVINLNNTLARLLFQCSLQSPHRRTPKTPLSSPWQRRLDYYCSSLRALLGLNAGRARTLHHVLPCSPTSHVPPVLRVQRSHKQKATWQSLLNMFIQTRSLTQTTSYRQRIHHGRGGRTKPCPLGKFYNSY